MDLWGSLDDMSGLETPAIRSVFASLLRSETLRALAEQGAQVFYIAIQNFKNGTVQTNGAQY
jgi:hypothetical protein